MSSHTKSLPGHWVIIINLCNNPDASATILISWARHSADFKLIHVSENIYDPVES